MSILFIFIFLLLLKGGESIPSEVPRDYPLEKLILVTRHGLRSPLKPLGSMIQNENILPNSRVNGQLTNIGREQMLEHGENYRKWLVDDEGFILDYFDPGEWNIRSTGSERTIESAQYIMKGVYPGSDERDKRICGTVNGNQICETIIPILSYNITSDPYLDPWDDCSHIQDKWSEILDNLPLCTEGEDFLNYKCTGEEEENIRKKFDLIATKLGMGYLDLNNLEYAFDPLITRYSTNGTYPPLITDDEYNLVIDRYEYATKNRFVGDEDVVKLLGSGLINYIIDDLEKVNKLFTSDNQDYEKVSYYSAHDYTIMGFMSSIGAYDGIPDFGSRLEITARRVTEPADGNPKLYINVSLNDEDIEIKDEKFVSSSTSIGDYNYYDIDTFISYLKSISIPMDDLTEYNELCGNNIPMWISDHQKYKNNLDKTKMSSGEVVVMVFGIILALTAIIMGILLFCGPIVRKMQRKKN